MMPAEWVPLFTAIANVGFSVVVAWYLLSKAIPGMQKKFSDDLDAQHKDFSADLKLQREDFSGTMVRERENWGAMLTLITGEDREMLKRNTEKTDRILSLVEDLARQNAANHVERPRK